MSDDVAARFGNAVRARRRSLNLNQRSLADQVGMDVVTISRIENGHINTSLSSAAKLADALGVSIDALLGGAARPSIPDDTRAEVAAAFGAVGKLMTDLSGRLAERDAEVS